MLLRTSYAIVPSKLLESSQHRGDFVVCEGGVRWINRHQLDRHPLVQHLTLRTPTSCRDLTLGWAHYRNQCLDKRLTGQKVKSWGLRNRIPPEVGFVPIDRSGCWDCWGCWDCSTASTSWLKRFRLAAKLVSEETKKGQSWRRLGWCNSNRVDDRQLHQQIVPVAGTVWLIVDRC